MTVTCQDRDRIFLDSSPEEWAALELHAASCKECAGELRAWKSLSEAAAELRDYREDHALWARIESSLRHKQQTRSTNPGFWDGFAFWKRISLGWQTALSGVLAVFLAFTGVYIYMHQTPPNNVSDKLLKNSALAEVERTERDYIKAVDKLAAEAKPQLDFPASPLMASYREKLIVLDSAIEELRAQAGQNPSNAHLRYQLLAMYQEKQETLHEVLETKKP
jgi:hypothetical protein